MRSSGKQAAVKRWSSAKCKFDRLNAAYSSYLAEAIVS
jgi:hypothetical protein